MGKGTNQKPGWYKTEPKHGKKPANRAWANQPGATRPSLKAKAEGKPQLTSRKG